MAAESPDKSSVEVNQLADKESRQSSARFSAELATSQSQDHGKSSSSQADTASKHLPTDFTITGAQDAPQSSSSFWGNVAHQSMLLGEGVISGSVGNAYNGVKQLVDHATGEQYKPTELFPNQKEVDGSLAGKIGSAVGTVADFAVLTVASGGALGAAGLAGVGGGVLAVGVSGAIEGGMLTPSDDKNFASGRFIDAGLGTAAGVIGLGAGLGIAALTKSVGNVAAASLRTAGGIGVGATLGVAVTEVTSLATTGKSASAGQLEFAATLGAVGGTFGALRFGSRNLKEGPENVSTGTPEVKNSLPGSSADGANAHFIESMQTGPVRFAEQSIDSDPRKAVSASIEMDAHKQDVLIRSTHNPSDTMAEQFHQLTDFESTIPRTTSRTVESLGPEGEKKFPGATSVDVQERVGRLIGDLQDDGTIKESDAQLTERVRDLSPKGTTDQLAQQIEQAVAERAIIGDNDVIDFNNITLSHENGQWKAANIDFDREHGAFSTEHEPWGTSPLSGLQISEDTLTKIGTLIKKLNTEEGRKSLSEIGLNAQESEALIARAQYLFTNKTFPPSDGFDFD